jgi:hypothetical protein
MLGNFVALNMYIPLNKPEWVNRWFYDNQNPNCDPILTNEGMLIFMSLFLVFNAITVLFFVSEELD